MSLHEIFGVHQVCLSDPGSWLQAVKLRGCRVLGLPTYISERKERLEDSLRSAGVMVDQ